MKRYFFFFAVVALATGCSVTRSVNYKEFSARNIEPRQDVLITPLKGNIELTNDGRVDETYTFTRKKEQPLRIPDCKMEALSATAQKYGADVIVGALTTVNYEVPKSGKTKTLTIRVTGYPARYVDFRNVDCLDSVMMRYYERTSQKEVSQRNWGIEKR